jgi:hypothetical protein
VYHVFDTARVGGLLVATTGAYPTSDVPYFSHRGPAALFVDAGAGHAWRRALEYPTRDVEGVVRFTYALALDDRSVIAAVQSSVAGVPAAVRIDGLPSAPSVHPVEGIAGDTLRWARFRDRVYNIADAADRSVLTRSGDGGRTFEPLASESPQSIATTDDAMYLLDDGALYISSDGEHFERVAASAPALRFRPSTLVSPPLVVHEGALWTASPTTGEIFVAVSR